MKTTRQYHGLEEARAEMPVYDRHNRVGNFVRRVSAERLKERIDEAASYYE